MRFHETELPGAFVLELERHVDERGFFARVFASDAFAERGLATDVVHASIAWNTAAGTIRGMHFQYPPHAEVKLVRCTRGAVLDAIVDLRPESATYLRSVTVGLDEETRCVLYVPERFAHGYQVLEDGTEVAYQMSTEYAPEAQGGLRWDDPALRLAWPLPVTVVSPRDRAWPLLAETEPELKRAMTISGAG
jgi:dTDP-4-dehydrorhamnose 3,5-epimerase